MNMLSVAPLAFLMLLRPSPQQQQTSGSIEGTITRQGSSLPVPNARVLLRSGEAVPQGRGGRGAPAAPLSTVKTDEKGKFAISGLGEGAYTLQVEADGYVSQTYGRRFARGPAAPIGLTAQQMAIKDVALSLVPAATISGRLRDGSGQPLPDVPVQLLRVTYTFNGLRAFESLPVSRTNDLGEYRLFWIKPGRYFLVAGHQATSARARASSGNLPSDVAGPAFYPSGGFANALEIDLRPGADRQGVDMTFASAPRTHSIRGKLIDSKTGQPPAKPEFTIELQTPGFTQGNLEISLNPSNFSYNASTGALELRGLSPGTYSITATVADAPPPGWVGMPPLAMAIQPVTVVDSDVDGIALAITPAGTLSGRVRAEGQLPAGVRLEGLFVQMEPIGSARETIESIYVRMGLGGIQGAPIGGDGTFRVDNVAPGEYRLDLGNMPADGGRLFIKEARFEGADILSMPMRYSGASGGVLEVMVAIGRGQIRGAVSDARSQPVGGALVVIVPDRARHRSDLYRVAYTAPNGQFALTGIAPGDYRIFSFEALEENAWLVSDVIARYEARGRSVRVSDGQFETIDVRVIPAEASQ